MVERTLAAFPERVVGVVGKRAQLSVASARMQILPLSIVQLGIPDIWIATVFN